MFPVVISLEWIGSNIDYARRYIPAWNKTKMYKRHTTYKGIQSRKPWVARVFISHGRMQRDFLKGQKDYSQSNASGSRGIFLRFVLYPGEIYEIFSNISYARTERFFARISGRSIERINEHEVSACLKNLSA